MSSRQRPTIRGKKPEDFSALASLLLASTSVVAPDEGNPVPPAEVSNAALAANDSSATQVTVVEVAQELQSSTSFTSFVLGGNGSTLLCEGVIFGYTVEERQAGLVRFFSVLRSENPKLPKGLTISSDEVARQVDEGKDYTPRGKAVDPVREMARAVMINTLRRAVMAVGGNDAVLEAIDGARRKAEAQKHRQMRADKILADIGNGKLSGDLLRMFDPMDIVMFGVIVDGKPAVLRSGTLAIDKQGQHFVHCVQVLSAPLGGLKQEAFVEVSKIFDESQPHPYAAALTKKLRTLFPEEQLPEAKRLAQELKGDVPKESVSEEVPGVGTFTLEADPTVQH